MRDKEMSSSGSGHSTFNSKGLVLVGDTNRLSVYVFQIVLKGVCIIFALEMSQESVWSEEYYLLDQQNQISNEWMDRSMD